MGEIVRGLRWDKVCGGDWVLGAAGWDIALKGRVPLKNGRGGFTLFVKAAALLDCDSSKSRYAPIGALAFFLLMKTLPTPTKAAQQGPALDGAEVQRRDERSPPIRGGL